MEIKDVENLTNLVRLKLTEEEKRDILADMSNILGYVKQIEKIGDGDLIVDLQNRNVWREDVPRGREFSKELIIKQFPEARESFLKVKKIL